MSFVRNDHYQAGLGEICSIPAQLRRTGVSSPITLLVGKGCKSRGAQDASHAAFDPSKRQMSLKDMRNPKGQPGTKCKKNTFPARVLSRHVGGCTTYTREIAKGLEVRGVEIAQLRSTSSAVLTAFSESCQGLTLQNRWFYTALQRRHWPPCVHTFAIGCHSPWCGKPLD
ncbi:hypothetical protein StoSoilB3_42210 (plasmid) [Arthrobacter sp. StoSoilB3]|nr:hypothetical protein StoSoilB3_42210 [Arthrobacter sp. StoSoilB3]